MIDPNENSKVNGFGLTIIIELKGMDKAINIIPTKSKKANRPQLAI